MNKIYECIQFDVEVKQLCENNLRTWEINERRGPQGVLSCSAHMNSELSVQLHPLWPLIIPPGPLGVDQIGITNLIALFTHFWLVNPLWETVLNNFFCVALCLFNFSLPSNFPIRGFLGPEDPLPSFFISTPLVGTFQCLDSDSWKGWVVVHFSL